MARPVTIRAAWIGGGCVVIAAIIAGVFALFHRPADVTTVAPQGGQRGEVLVMGRTGDLTINYNVPETATKEAIEALETSIKNASQDIMLTRNDVRLLANALKDLDQRTAGVEKLRDGRTKIGDIVSGYPRVVADLHGTAFGEYGNANYEASLGYSQKAINAYETSKDKGSVLESGKLDETSVGSIYALGAQSAQRLGKHELALAWARKAVEAHPTPEYRIFLSVCLFNLRIYEEAKTLAEQALKEDSTNQNIRAMVSGMREAKPGFFNQSP